MIGFRSVYMCVAVAVLSAACVVKQPMGVGGEVRGQDEQQANQPPPTGTPPQGTPPEGTPPEPAPPAAEPPRAEHATTGVATEGAVVDCAQEFGTDVSPDLASAKALPDGAIVQGCFTPGDRGDAYVLTAAKNPGGVLYRLRVQSSERQYTCFELFNADRERKASHCVRNDQQDEMWIAVAGGTSFYVHAKNGSHLAKMNRPYKLEVSQRLIQDASEPNDVPEQATPLRLGQAQSGYALALANNVDAQRDVYRVALSKPGTLEIVVADMPQETRLKATLTNADGEKFGTRHAKNRGATLRGEWKVKAAGDYFVTLEWAHTGHNKVADKGAPPTYTERQYTLTATQK